MWPFGNKSVFDIKMSKIPVDEFLEGDVLLVRYPGKLPLDKVKHICEYISSELPAGIRVLALPDDVSISRLTRDSGSVTASSDARGT